MGGHPRLDVPGMAPATRPEAPRRPLVARDDTPRGVTRTGHGPGRGAAEAGTVAGRPSEGPARRTFSEHVPPVNPRAGMPLTTHQDLPRGARSGIAAGSVGAERGDAAWWEGSRRSPRRSAGTWADVCPGSTRRSGTAWPC